MPGKRLVQFLQHDLLITEAAIGVAWKGCNRVPYLLPITLWQYGFIDISQLEQILDWQVNIGRLSAE